MKLKTIFPGARAESLIISAVLILAVVAGLVLFVLQPKETFSQEENRGLQSFPAFDAEDLFAGKYTKKFETYLADQFPARNFFVGINCDVQLLLQKEDVGGVYFGKDDYLFEILKQPDPDILQSNLTGINSLADRTNLPVYLLPVPSSAQEMKERLPAYAPSYDQNLSVEAMEKNLSPKVTLVNVMDALKPRDGETLYFKTDHHWNVFGAYKGYSALMNAMGLNPVPISDIKFEKVTSDFYGTLYSKAGYKRQKPDEMYIQQFKEPQQITCVSGGQTADSLFDMSKLDKKDQYTIYIGGNTDENIIRNAGARGERILIIKDSYAHIAVPYLANHFSEIRMIDLRYFRKDPVEYIRENQIDRIVILYSIKQLDEVVTLGDM